MTLRCSSCNNEYSDMVPRWRCDCGSYLCLEGTGMFRPDQVKGRATSLWRHADEADRRNEKRVRSGFFHSSFVIRHSSFASILHCRNDWR